MRNRNLDGARGLAALSVALAHCNTDVAGVGLYSSTAGDFHLMGAIHIAMRLWHTIFNGDAAVILFFALSGYVLGRSLERLDSSPANAFFPYLIRRLFRLYPVSIAGGALAFILFPITFRQMLGTMFLTDISVNGALWSLQVELVGSVFIFALWAANRRVLVLALLAFYAYLFRFVPEWAMVVSSNFVMLPVAFVLGYAIPMVPISIWRSRSLLVVSLAALLLSDLFLGRTWDARIGQILGAFALVGCVRSQTIDWLDSRPVQFLGEVSYPFYLVHVLIAILFHAQIERMMPHAAVASKIIVLAATSIPISLAIAWAISKLVEKPGIRAGAALLSFASNRLVRAAR